MSALLTPRYKRILLKLSGEALMGEEKGGANIDNETVKRFVDEVAEVVKLGVQVGVVVGGGNIFRGVSLNQIGMERAMADYVGMLATMINALVLQDAFRQSGMNARVQSALNMQQISESYIRGKTLRYLEEETIVIFGAGTGNPFFTTDTAAALRGVEIGADIVLKATKVDGVYTDDPKINPDAMRYKTLTFDEALSRNLHVMDATALALCRDQKMPLCVFSIFKAGALKRVVLGEDEGTHVTP